MQLHLRPDAARVERDLDAVEHLPGTALAPEIVIGRMRGNHLRQIGFLIARRAAGGEAVDEAVLVPPVAGEEIARDAAVIGAGAVKIRQTVMRRDARKRRRRERRP